MVSSVSGREVLLSVEHLVYSYGKRSGLPAVDDVSLWVGRGETVGLVGESGCGKTTLARCVVRLLRPSSGTIRLGDHDISKLRPKKMRPLRQRVQMVFQDPMASLNPRKRVGEIVAEGFRLRHGRRGSYAEEVAEVLQRVGLRPEFAGRFPHEFSGGQRQRIGIARCLAAESELIVLDEPVSALDVSVQAQVVNLLMQLQAAQDLSYLFVAHDLAVVRQACNRIIVMYMGKVAESADCDSLYERPVHPYTRALLASAPRVERTRYSAPRVAPIKGEAIHARALAAGCRFRDRCPNAQEVCATVEPALMQYPRGQLVACHFPEGVSDEEIAGAVLASSSPASAGDVMPARLQARRRPAGI